MPTLNKKYKLIKIKSAVIFNEKKRRHVLPYSFACLFRFYTQESKRKRIGFISKIQFFLNLVFKHMFLC